MTIATDLDVRPLSPLIGAEIHGVDLSAPLSPPVVADIRWALNTHHVVFFRDQQLTPTQQADFARVPLPVFFREGVHGQHFDAQTLGRAHDPAQASAARGVTFDGGQLALRGPAPIAVHDDGHVARRAARGVGANGLDHDVAAKRKPAFAVLRSLS